MTGEGGWDGLAGGEKSWLRGREELVTNRIEVLGTILHTWYI